MDSEVKTNLFKIFRWISDRLRGLGISRIPLVMRLHNFLYRTLIPNWDLSRQVKVLNYEMIVDLKDTGDLPHALISKGIYDPLMTKVLQDVVRPGMAVVDVGANIGYFSLILAEAATQEGLVYAIEPEARNYNLLLRNLSLNGYLTSIQPIQVAISNETLTGTLVVNDKYHGSHFLLNQSLDPVDKRLTTTRIVSLDHLFENCEIHFVKVDVQGAEMDVLEGMETLLDYEDIGIIWQYIPDCLVKFGRDPKDFLDKLASHRFRFWDVNEKKKKVVPTDVETLLKQYPVGRGTFTNILVRR
ncbi:hypothetical protein LCGC14_1558400 [marine sediment metagenome]|uniref:Methyltransferase FkbM domain-containing protein n=1 Tax=marine sediment metagenome TaxID=412755 RepID=A0A0F9LP59_9ZZZZ